LKGFSNFQYLGKLKKYKNEEIKSRIVAGKRCFYSLGHRFRSRAMDKAIKINIFEMKVKPVAVYGSATRPMKEADMKRLIICERKIFRRIYRPVAEQAIWRIRTNQELQELYKDLDIVADIKKESLKGTGHLDRMDHVRVVKNIIENKLKGRGTKRPRLRGWKMMKRIYSKRRL
jgi:hypothetical protein